MLRPRKNWRGLPFSGSFGSHLLMNAIMYSPDGSTVSVTARSRAGFVEIAVEDDGTGKEGA